MNPSQRPRFHRLLIPLTALLGLAWLAACQPAATPQTITAVETVVVTEIVEGEPIEVVITATPAPVEEPASEEPVPTLVPGPTITPFAITVQVSPTPLDIEDRRVEAEWPSAMQPDESATIRLSFVPVDGGFEIVTEFPDDQLQVTEVAVKQLAEYELSARAVLDGVGFTVSPPGEQTRLVTPGEPLTWYWTVTPKQTGSQRLSLSLLLHWEPLAGGKSREAVVYSKGLSIQVGAASRPGWGLAGVGMVCLGLLTVGALSLGVWGIGRMRPRATPGPSTSASGLALREALPLGPGAPSAIHIEPPSGVTLSPTETALLSSLFARYARLVIEREFLSGYSGARTFLAVPIRPDSRVDAHTIIKIADQGSVQREYENYENFVKTTLPPATARIQQTPVRLEGRAALQYTFLGGPGYTPASLRQALLQTPDPRLLWKLFDTFAPNWWMQHKPYVFRLGQEYDRKLPTHYVLEPCAGTPDAVLDGQNPPVSADTWPLGTILTLKNFPHAEPRPGGQTLALTNAALPGHPPVRVRWNGRSLSQGATGRLLATRTTLLRDACAGLPLFALPDPLEKLPALLNERINGTQSLIHGDLNVENILVGPSAWVWLIDFAETRDGHTLYDFAHLYAELIAHVIAPQIPQPTDYLEILRDGAEPLLAAVREMAGRCLFDPKQMREFDVAVIVSVLGALKFANLSPHARHLLVLTAAFLAQDVLNQGRG
ncbi:MAG: aminoglycoside phosphotransferase family protein [Anaerolineales bacterium]|nr:aminoglycoside phosphotransferase family protein [Anaerolineales bacterium]